jgi:hypothetical protein
MTTDFFWSPLPHPANRLVCSAGACQVVSPVVCPIPANKSLNLREGKP